MPLCNYNKFVCCNYFTLVSISAKSEFKRSSRRSDSTVPPWEDPKIRYMSIMLAIILQNHSLLFLFKTASKIKYEKVWTKIFNYSLKNGYFGALRFQELKFFDHFMYNFKTS